MFRSAANLSTARLIPLSSRQPSPRRSLRAEARRGGITILFAVLTLFLASSLAAQQGMRSQPASCLNCQTTEAQCVSIKASNGVGGRSACAGGYTDWHTNAQCGASSAPCPGHCHVSLDTCVGCVDQFFISSICDPISTFGTGTDGYCDTDEFCVGTNCSDPLSCLCGFGDNDSDGICDTYEEWQAWTGGGGGGGGGLQAFVDPDHDPIVDPIVISIHGGYKFSGEDDQVSFDIDGDGDVDRLTWTARGSATGFLAFDRSGNGRIDNGSELFTDASDRPILGDRSKWTGFMLLGMSDSNEDDEITEADDIWTKLLLWIDANHDGESQPAELTSLAANGITALGLKPTHTGRRDPNGNLLRWKSSMRINGHAAPYYDVYLRVGD